MSVCPPKCEHCGMELTCQGECPDNECKIVKLQKEVERLRGLLERVVSERDDARKLVEIYRPKCQCGGELTLDGCKTYWKHQ